MFSNLIHYTTEPTEKFSSSYFLCVYEAQHELNNSQITLSKVIVIMFSNIVKWFVTNIKATNTNKVDT